MNSNENDKEKMIDHWKHRRACRRHFVLKLPFIGALVLLKGAAIMLLWNALIPDLFHGPTLHYFQAVGLMVLAKLLVGFGGFHRFGGHHHRHHAWKARWMQMTPEERQKLREEFRRRCRG